MDITKEEYLSYEKVRLSGEVNMFDATSVARLSGLTKERVIDVMKQYNECTDLYGPYVEA